MDISHRLTQRVSLAGHLMVIVHGLMLLNLVPNFLHFFAHIDKYPNALKNIFLLQGNGTAMPLYVGLVSLVLFVLSVASYRVPVLAGKRVTFSVVGTLLAFIAPLASLLHF